MIIYSKETIGEQWYLVLTYQAGNKRYEPFNDEASIDIYLTGLKDILNADIVNLQEQIANKTDEITSIDNILP